MSVLASLPTSTRLGLEPARPAVTEVRPSETGADRLLLTAVLALATFGVVMVFSAGAVFAGQHYGDATYFLKRELVFGAVGLAALWVGLRVDYSLYRRLAYPLLFLAIGLLASVLVVGSRAGGAVRWFRLGPLSFQPGELAKVAMSIYLASLLARKAEKVKDFSVGFLPPLLVTGVVMALLLAQPDFGTAVIFGLVALGLLFVAGTRTSYLIMAMLVAAPIGWRFIVGTPFRMRRMLAFLDPWAYRRETGYQLTESLISVGSGGPFGVGLGDGRQKLFFLPEAHTDFILSVVGEELGFVGLVGVMLAFGVIVWRGLRAATRARDPFGCYLAFAITAFIGLQALVNMGVVLGALPTKGLPLPFVSYGGTSMAVSLFMAGILANVSARHREPRTLDLWKALRPRRGRSANRRAEPPVRVVVLTTPPSRPRLTPSRAPTFASMDPPVAPAPEATPLPTIASWPWRDEQIERDERDAAAPPRSIPRFQVAPDTIPEFAPPSGAMSDGGSSDGR